MKCAGNVNLKEGRIDEARKKYQEAIQVASMSKELYKEAAVVYSNMAKLLYSLKKYEDALINAIAAIKCDTSYHKVEYEN